MADVRSDIIVAVGGSPHDAVSERVGLSDNTPHITWDLPEDVSQVRYAVRVDAVDTEAYAESGERFTTDTHFDWPQGVAMGSSFAGQCEVRVFIGERDDGPWDYVSEPLLFVFDPNPQHLPLRSEVALRWVAARDADLVPEGNLRLYHLQVATDPAFASIAHEAKDIAGGGVDVTMPLPEAIGPDEGLFFFRVRQSDGMDYGPWSTAHFFTLAETNPPVLDLMDLEELESGVWRVTFKLSHPDDLSCGVEITYTGGSVGELETPLVLQEATTSVRPGVRSVTWVVREQEPDSQIEVLLKGVADDGTRRSRPDFIGPFTIDTSQPAPAGGLGSTTYRLGVRSNIRSADVEAEVAVPPTPVVTKVQGGDLEVREAAPVISEVFDGKRFFVMGPVERTPYGQLRPGGDDEDLFGPEKFQFPHLPVLPHGEHQNQTLRGMYGNGMLELDRSNPHTSSDQFLFADPTAWENHADGHPRPLGWHPAGGASSTPSSRMVGRTRCLDGYTTRFGDVTKYEGPVTFNHTSPVHKGRERWVESDAWLQVGVVKVTDYEPCATCGGQGWVVGNDGGDVVRNPCPNPTCVDGFDHSVPLTETNGEKTWRVTKAYLDVAWMRLSWLLGQPYADPLRKGLLGVTELFKPGRAYVAGRQLSDMDGVYTYVCQTVDGEESCSWELQHYLFEQADGDTLFFSKNAAANHRFKPIEGIDYLRRQQLVRDPDGGTAMGTRVVSISTAELDVTVPPTPISSRFTDTVDHQGDPKPVASRIGPTQDEFFMGSDAALPGHTFRPSPNQVGIVGVKADFGRVYNTTPLSFAYLQPVWDAYNAIHWQMTGSTTSRMQVEIARYVPLPEGGTERTDWAGVRFDNGVYNADLDAYLVRPLEFLGYWDTADRSVFPSGGLFRLRMRQVDPESEPPTFTEWVYSRQFVIQDGATNPVTMLGLTYEPWSGIVNVDFRIDDSDGDAYTLQAFWYSVEDGPWIPVSNGDITGNIAGLQASPLDGEPIVHTIKWNARNYNLPAADRYRFRIRALPTGSAEQIQLPFFKWLTPVNPYLDDAEYELSLIYGRVVTTYFDPEQDAFVDYDPPVREPGRLTLLNNRYEAIRDNGFWDHHTPDAGGTVRRPWVIDSSGSLPAGWQAENPGPYTAGQAVTTLWSVADQEGLDAWYEAEYRDGQTHGQALANVAGQRDRLLGVSIPQLTEVVQREERAIRADLIHQGFFAESHFPEGAEGIEETYRTRTLVLYQEPNANSGVDDNLDGSPVDRPWRFRVQSQAASDVEQPDGVEQTPLETVRYVLQLDPLSTFDSQSGRPLREFISNYDGQPLTVSEFLSPEDTGAEVVGDSVPVGGVLKIAPVNLPGGVEGDQLPAGQEDWYVNHHWRVRAYNPVEGPVTATPRSRADAMVLHGGVARFSLRTTAHPQLSLIEFGDPNGQHWGYQVGSQKASPGWESLGGVAFVSDRRADLASNGGGVNTGEAWVPAGAERYSVSIHYDDRQHQYLIYYAKPDFDGRYRIMESRAMDLQNWCEKAVLFSDEPYDAITGPAIVPWDDGYALFVTIQNSGQNPTLAYATSEDGITWSTLTNIGLVLAHFDACRDDRVEEVTDPETDEVTYVTHPRVRFLGVDPTGPVSYTTEDLMSFVSVSIGLPPQYEQFGLAKLGDRLVVTARVEDNDVVTLESTDGESWSAIGPQLSFGATPYYPRLFVDLVGGYDEVYLIGQTSTLQGVSDMHLYRWEEYDWADGDTQALIAQDGQSTNVTIDRQIEHTLSLSASAGGIAGADAVRIYFRNAGSSTHEYRRQSAWITPAEAEATGSYLDPNPWLNHPMLENYPYLQ